MKKDDFPREFAIKNVNIELGNLWDYFRVVRAFRDIGKDLTKEGIQTLADFGEKIRDFQKEYPDVPIPSKLLKEVFGG